MCGIAGVVGELRPGDRDALGFMTAALRHRGPDGDGIYVDTQALLASRRLAIIDVPGGRQPMGNETGTVQVVFNGEIYNFAELREGLRARGHRFVTRSDTEVLIHAYEAFGESFVEKLDGMFAFALWDVAEQRLILARDRLGKKPLFYVQADGAIIFSSELHSLILHPRVPRHVDPAAIDQYLSFGYIPAPWTIYRDVKKLEPAHYLVWERGRVRTERYWVLRYAPKLRLAETEALDQLESLLREAVRKRLVSDVPLGAFLSGGIDSSAVVALMTELAEKPARTFTIGFEDQEYSELAYARTVAAHLGTDHHECVVKSDAVEVLPTLVRHYGEPYGDSSALPTYYLAQQARGALTVALNGDGGDECFAGYDRYLGQMVAERYRRLPAWARGVAESVVSLAPGRHEFGRWNQLTRYLPVASLPWRERHIRWTSAFTETAKAVLYTDKFKTRLGEADATAWLAPHFAATEGLDLLDANLYLDIQSYLPYDLLVKMDIATMANSVEVRSPFLDSNLMEFCAQLPAEFKLRGQTHKYLLKRLLAGRLPPAILNRRKMGFGTPVGRWFRTDLRSFLSDTLLAPTVARRGLFRPEVVAGLITAHVTGREDHTHRLWVLLMLEMWFREFAD
jgi:asparagine synthase (glutamine-hydrolysing)